MIIITGGSSGIGKHIRDHLRSCGERVITLSRREIKDDEDHYKCDIADFASLKRVYQRINKNNYKVNSLINSLRKTENPS